MVVRLLYHVDMVVVVAMVVARRFHHCCFMLPMLGKQCSDHPHHLTRLDLQPPHRTPNDAGPSAAAPAVKEAEHLSATQPLILPASGLFHHQHH
ncbi:UNVERIFIED_CONTAM: hypothetical protein Slati_2169100 [Sesamum latifolium]|uniref:Secreted protein n=1 Tax=Sesamum latifolium TaxID=2727402 RepID=A0AAW2WU28_9LAMI